jgi:hypothetical protein
MDVRLHIERLVLDGFTMKPAQRHALVCAAEGELSRLISAGGVSSSVAAGFSAPALKGGVVRATSPFDPVSFGRDLARALYAGIRRHER